MEVRRIDGGLVEVRFIRKCVFNYEKRRVYHLNGNDILDLSLDEVPFMVIQHRDGVDTVAQLHLPEAIAVMHRLHPCD